MKQVACASVTNFETTETYIYTHKAARGEFVTYRDTARDIPDLMLAIFPRLRKAVHSEQSHLYLLHSPHYCRDPKKSTLDYPGEQPLMGLNYGRIACSERDWDKTWTVLASFPVTQDVAL